MIANASSDHSFLSDLEAALLEDLRASSIQAHNSRIDLAVRGDDGALLAGLAATTSYGWLRVNMVWVSTSHRRTSLGRQMMHEAMDLGLERGCHAAWLETSSPQARTFYENLGFEVFAELANDAENVPMSHRRWFLRRTLTTAKIEETP